MKYIIYLISFIATISSCKKNTNIDSPYEDGVPKDLAVYRSQQISDVHYSLSFTIPLKKESPIVSDLKLNLEIHDLNQPLLLDFKASEKNILSLTVNNTKVLINHKKEHLIINTDYLLIGSNTITINFIAGDLSLNRNENYLYTLLVPDRARTLFPCFDQPDIKAVFDLKIIAPKNWNVLTSSPLISKKEENSFTHYQFAKSDKMSTYLFSFIAGEFETASNKSDDILKQMLFRETNEEKIKASTDSIFILHQLSMDFLEKYTNYSFPFKKLDIASIPGYQYGGMEHVGAIQYKESSLFLDSSATQNQKITRAKLIAHESAHMWFGNLVTMKWFDDVWLKEVFANFMADKIINPIFDDVDHNLKFLTSHYPSAYSVDRTKGTNAIRQNLDNLKNAGSLYGNIIYHKSPIMMRQLEAAMGKDKFREGIIEYIKTYANSNAEWNDLIRILDTKSPLDIEEWSKIWVNSSSRPIIYSKIAYDNKNKIKSLEIEQKAEDGSEKIWGQIFDITLVYSDSSKVIPINLNAKKLNIPSAIGLSKPDYILYNSNGFGYGVFPIDIDKLIASDPIKDDVARAHSFINCYENVLSGYISILKAFEYYQNALHTESNKMIMNVVSGKLKVLYSKFLTDEQRLIYQPKLEKIVLNKLNQDQPADIKKTLFNLYKTIAYSDSGIEHLYGIWTKDIIIPNLILNENDFTSLAKLLALYEHSKTDEILDKAKSELTNPDKIEEFEFILPALSQNENVRSEFFKSFKEAKNREKENWVLSACSYIHHPLRQKFSIKDLELSLELLDEIQKTGDIFFPKNWLDNTIGLYTSKEALDILEKFILSHPDLNPALKNKVLQSTDILYRVQALKKSD